MSLRSLAWSVVYRGKGRLSREAGAALFQGLRIRLTLWYCGVLGAAMVLFSVTLYLGAQYFLIQPIEADTQTHAQVHMSEWLLGQFDRACSSFGPQGQFGPAPDQGFLLSEIVVCFDQNGVLLPGENTVGLPPGFLTNTLVKSALQTGYAYDMVDGGDSVGSIYRYALVVPGPTGNGDVDVIMIGESTQAQESALSLLLILLLSVGGVALLGAGVGGLFLANRALAPARLAWANQQRFISDASHELRTPLTLLRADAEVLLRSCKHLMVEDAALLEDIVIEANYMSTIATNMLTLARLDTGTIHREHEVVSFVELVQECARRVQALADQKSITVLVENIGTPYVIGDPMLLEQVLLVLLDNALKYNQQGGHVTVRTAERDGQALLEVRGSGIGIAAEHLPHLGERFYRVDKARSREAGGTGLGLSIAQSIAVAHGGRLSLSSVPEQGTTVTLTLPLVHGDYLLGI